VPPMRRLAPRRLAFVVAASSCLILTTAAHALRVLDYNILNYPGSTGPTRDPLFRTVIGPLAPDIIVTEETNSAAGVSEFLNSVLNTLEPGQWAAAPFVDGNDTDCGFFYKTAKVQYLGQWSFYPNSANLLRLVHVYRIRPVGYSSGATDIRFYAFHLKASTGSANEAQRLAEATGIRDSMNAMPPGTHAFAVGDFNVYRGTEPALQKVIESQMNNIGRLYDPLGLQNLAAWQDQSSIAVYHTQSPCLSGGTACASGASTGGLDDRFDLILPTLNWNDGQGYELVPGTYISCGNDGQHLNLNITDPPTIPEGTSYANALIFASDHLPLRVDIQLPAQINAPMSLAFGTVIAGASTDLSVGNPASPPADALTYSFAAPAGFTAPGGTFNLAAQASALHAIATTAGPPFGTRTGNLTLATDDPDRPTATVGLSANVLDHAAASLDSSSLVAQDTIDFGANGPGSFSDRLARVHNFGYDALQARLSVTSGTITGGGGHFSLVGDFHAALVADVGEGYQLHFDDAGATPDSVYEATLTFGSSDEALPGGAPMPDLVVQLRAMPLAGSTGVGDSPTALRFYPAHPNPFSLETRFAFELPRAADVTLEVFDLSGRRVASLVKGSQGPGRHDVPWRPLDAGGARLSGGLYFARFSTTGLSRTERFVLLP
jgi:FlgD Ig-like domain